MILPTCSIWAIAIQICCQQWDLVGDVQLYFQYSDHAMIVSWTGLWAGGFLLREEGGGRDGGRGGGGGDENRERTEARYLRAFLSLGYRVGFYKGLPSRRSPRNTSHTVKTNAQKWKMPYKCAEKKEDCKLQRKNSWKRSQLSLAVARELRIKAFLLASRTGDK